MWIKHNFCCFLLSRTLLLLKAIEGLGCSIKNVYIFVVALRLTQGGSRMTLVDITELCNSFLCFHHHGAMQVKFQSIAILYIISYIYFHILSTYSHINCHITLPQGWAAATSMSEMQRDTAALWSAMAPCPCNSWYLLVSRRMLIDW